jgi:hypothetical protein
MALVRCQECGRMISDQAAACVGCGAPLSADTDTDTGEPAILLTPRPSHEPPLTRAQLRGRTLGAALTFLVGLFACVYLGQPGGNRVVATIAALVLIGGFCWLIVTIVQNVMARK